MARTERTNTLRYGLSDNDHVAPTGFSEHLPIYHAVSLFCTGKLLSNPSMFRSGHCMSLWYTYPMGTACEGPWEWKSEVSEHQPLSTALLLHDSAHGSLLEPLQAGRESTALRTGVDRFRAWSLGVMLESGPRCDMTWGRMRRQCVDLLLTGW